MVKTILVGVDEAGRGPLIGDLVLSLVALFEDDADFLRGVGVKDSKELAPGKRAEVASFIYGKAVLVLTTHIPAPYLDRFVSKPGLNKLEAQIVVKMLKHVYAKFIEFPIEALFKIYVDEIKGYGEYTYNSIKTTFGSKLIEFRFEPGADRKHIAVSAASVIAKFHRDSCLNVVKTLYGDFGSGYPSDPRTREWVLKNYSVYRKPPPIVRKTWSTLRRIAPEWHMDFKKQTILDYIER